MRDQLQYKIHLELMLVDWVLSDGDPIGLVNQILIEFKLSLSVAR